MSRSFNALRRAFAYVHPGASLGNRARFTEEDRERKKSYCERVLGLEFAYYADKAEDKSAEYYAWHGSFESKARYIAAALNNKNVALINALGGNVVAMM